MKNLTLTVAVVSALTSSAMADYTITQGDSAPTYSGHQIDFDQAGDPVGMIVGDEWLASDHINIMSGLGDGGNVDDWDAVYGGWGLGDGNSHVGGFGTFLTFDQDVTEMSLQIWNNGVDPFFGGIGISLYKDGAEVAFMAATPAWGTADQSWFNFTTTGGDTFDEVRIVDWDFASFGIFTDNYSYNVVPAPGAMALLGLAGVCGRRRRRA